VRFGPNTTRESRDRPSALVTGAARGIGRSIVIRLAANGWDVAASVRHERDAAAVRAVDPRRVSPVMLDITNADHIAALEGSLPQRLDAVVNNAGIVVAGPIEAVIGAEFRGNSRSMSLARSP
jgi:NAD(P)-dependent dehydrogenase (short-subunit alcohol dehydrogenase family)